MVFEGDVLPQEAGDFVLEFDVLLLPLQQLLSLFKLFGLIASGGSGGLPRSEFQLFEDGVSELQSVVLSLQQVKGVLLGELLGLEGNYFLAQQQSVGVLFWIAQHFAQLVVNVFHHLLLHHLRLVHVVALALADLISGFYFSLEHLYFDLRLLAASTQLVHFGLTLKLGLDDGFEFALQLAVCVQLSQ